MKSNPLSRIIRIAACIGISTTLLPGDVVVLEPSKDNSIYEEGALSNGKGIFLVSGKSGSTGGYYLRYALIQFDLSGSIPAGSTVESVTLDMYVSQVANGDATNERQFKLHRITSDWGEGTSDASFLAGQGAIATPGDATWLNAFHPSQPWNFEGGDFSFLESASTPITGKGFYSWNSAGMVSDVAGWVSNPASNFGWMIIGPNVDTTARRFDSRENPNEVNRPKLTVTYTPPPQLWGGYTIEPDGRTVLTGDFLGAIDIASSPWIYVHDLQGWIYLPESHVSEQGGWAYAPR